MKEGRSDEQQREMEQIAQTVAFKSEEERNKENEMKTFSKTLVSRYSHSLAVYTVKKEMKPRLRSLLISFPFKNRNSKTK